MKAVELAKGSHYTKGREALEAMDLWKQLMQAPAVEVLEEERMDVDE